MLRDYKSILQGKKITFPVFAVTIAIQWVYTCLLYTSDAADDYLEV